MSPTKCQKMAASKRARTRAQTTTQEPVNCEQLRSLVARAATDNIVWPGCTTSIRSTLAACIARCDDDGCITSTWHEANAEYGFNTRRFSNQSLFSLPGVLRDAGRGGKSWNTMDVDQENCYPRAQLARHPCKPVLARYVAERKEILAEVQTACGVSRGAAKELFLRLMFGGSVDTWQREHGAQGAVPEFVSRFADEQNQIRAEDAEKNPALLEQLSDEDRPAVSLQSQLNMRHEREVLDAMEKAVHGIAEVAAYEHDGLFLYTTRFDADNEAAGRAWRREVLEAIHAKVTPHVAEKTPRSFEEVLSELEARWPDEDWSLVDDEESADRIIEQAVLIEEARGRMPHRVCACIVALEDRAWPGSQYSVRDVFKHLASGVYAHWDPAVAQWVTDNGRDALLHVISEVLGRRLGRGEGALANLDSIGFTESVEKFLRSLLRDRAFKLDDQRRYLVFSNGAFDLAAGCLVPLSPSIRSSHSTGWAWEGSGLTPQQEEEMRAALDAAAQDETAMTSAAGVQLEGVARNVPAFGFLFDICGSWERVLYLTKHLARATFALPYQENLWTRGPGSNGKDTLANLMLSLLGGYFSNLPCEALTSGREMDAPSQTLLALRGKRFVAVREIARNAKIRSHVYKTISDPKGMIKARGLYGKDEEFSPHFLLYMASNVPVEIDDSSGGCARRTRIVDLPFNFVESPQEANERQRDAGIEGCFPAWRAGLFHLLFEVYTRFLQRPQSNITPVPQDVQEAVDEELQEEWMEMLVRFVASSLQPARSGSDASSAVDVRHAFFAHTNGAVPNKEVGLRLSRKGFAEESVNYWEGAKRTKKRVYRLKFPDGTTALVRLQTGSTGGT